MRDLAMKPGRNRPGHGRAAGFTLVEMMIAVALGLMILAALTTFFVQSSANRAEMERGARQIENGRYAMSSLREDVAVAGFYYDISQASPPLTWQAPTPCLTRTDATFPNHGFKTIATAPAGALNLPLPMFGYDAADAGIPSCVTDKVGNSDVLVIRRFNTESTPVASAEANQFYVQISHCRTDSTEETFSVGPGSAGAGAFGLHEVDCSTIARLWRYREHVYYVRNYSATAGDGIPTLVRLELDNNAMNAVPLVEGIQAMRIEYGLDTSGDGAPDVWRQCSTATPCSAAEWAQVTAIRVYILSSNIDSSPGYQDAKTYDLGLAGTVGPYNDAYKRHVYTAVMNATNRSGLLERQ